MHITLNAYLTLCACNYWHSGTDQTIKECRLTETKVNCMKVERFIWTKLSFDLKRNGCHKPSDLSGMSIIVVSEGDKTLRSSLGFFKI